MFLSRKPKGEQPDAARTGLDQIAKAHGGKGQKILAFLVALGAVGAVGTGLALHYIVPALKSDKPALDTTAKTTEAKPTAQLKVPIDLAGETSGPAPAVPVDNPYQPLPGLAADARPSPAPVGAGRAPRAAQPSQSAPVGAPLPPGMAEAQYGQGGAPVGASGEAGRDPIHERKLNGDLGDFGESGSERFAANGRSASGGLGKSDDACSGVQGGPDAVAECNRRVSARVPAPVAPLPSPPAAAAPQNGAGLANQLVAISTPNGKVGTVPNPHLTLRKGEGITCTLDTAIGSEQAGFVECVTDYPIYSMDGKVILAERGTRIEGEYSRDVSPGSHSIFVLWTRAVTPAPYNVTFELLSPGSDRLGRSGITGDVDNKYWERYSGPLMFSLLQDVSAALSAKAAGSSSSAAGVFILPSTQAAGQNAVAELLKQGSDVKRSLYRNQGDTISITVARYIDFSPIYRLRTIKGRS